MDKRSNQTPPSQQLLHLETSIPIQRQFFSQHDFYKWENLEPKGPLTGHRFVNLAGVDLPKSMQTIVI